MAEHKVFIPSAGAGTRIKTVIPNLNKALIDINNKPVISHIIDKFDKSVEIVVGLGHESEDLADYLSLAHDDRKITMYQVSDPDVGLGLTLLEAQEFLQCPFTFCPNDTLVKEPIFFLDPEIPNKLISQRGDHTQNWLGYTYNKNNEEYRTLEIHNRPEENRNYVTSILSKNSNSPYAYIGLANIYDYEQFWGIVNKYRNDEGFLKTGEVFPIKLMLNDFKAKEFTWYDTGNLESLNLTREILKESSEYSDVNILNKPDEAIWFVNNRVIKYSIDEKFIKNRIERARTLQPYVPEITHYSKRLYCYDWVSGKTLSNLPNIVDVFDKLLEELKDFWSKHQKWSYSSDESYKFTQRCMKFYKNKTYDRVAKYFDIFEQIDQEETINGTLVPRIKNLLQKVDWKDLSNGFPCKFHGDLHFENILLTDDSEFMFLDWRQDFAGDLQYGDMYYDLAKLNHGLVISHDLVNQKRYTCDKDGTTINFDILRKNNLIYCQDILHRFVSQCGLSWNKVDLLTDLIFLNCAPLHEHPYSMLLFYLGKYNLHRKLLNG